MDNTLEDWIIDKEITKYSTTEEMWFAKHKIGNVYLDFDDEGNRIVSDTPSYFISKESVLRSLTYYLNYET